MMHGVVSLSCFSEQFVIIILHSLYWSSIFLSLSRSYCVYCSFYHCIVFIYSAVKLPVCFNKLTYLLTYLLTYVAVQAWWQIWHIQPHRLLLLLRLSLLQSLSLLSQPCDHHHLVSWHSGRTSVFGQRTFPVPRSTCSVWVTIYVGKSSATGQVTGPTEPFILSRSINWAVIRCLHGWRRLVNAYRVKAWCGWLERWCVC